VEHRSGRLWSHRLYTLATLVEQPDPMLLTIYEAAPLGGVGMPYSPDATHIAMLANIASIEIPPLTETYLDWLHRQPGAFLRIYGVDPETLHDRQFLPRLLLGGYFRDQFERLLERGCAAGHQIALRERCRVVDIEALPEGLRLLASTDGAEPEPLFHDRVILATGHVWPDEAQNTPTYYLSPWTGLPEAEIPAARIGVLGTSLSAIDAAMSIALQHGRFSGGSEGAAVVYEPHDPAAIPRITLMSRSGILPEADFYCPLPYEPLQICTEEAAKTEAARGPQGLLDRLFALFAAQLAAADPDYAAGIGLDDLTADSFSAAYFAGRSGVEPFDHAAHNLAEVLENHAAKRTVAWRYAILRMHEVFDRMIPMLDEADLGRFDGGLKTVFVDNYAAIPPSSVSRLLALHAAGVVEVLRLGRDYDLDERGSGVAVSGAGGDRRFDLFIDARGQRPLDLAALPFPGLRRQLAQDADPKGREIAVDPQFRLQIPERDAAEIRLAALPFLMRRRPFIQGITAAAEIGTLVARSILPPVEEAPLRARSPRAEGRRGQPGEVSRRLSEWTASNGCAGC
ncbi:FAD/NAD(P)-binding protein, partial [Cereibacter changlensis]|uniref:FAD/NAD(P)-binding protein n=1 Tax=Cereibacter changlensis TaxID=402884 RepID=UPI001C634CB8